MGCSLRAGHCMCAPYMHLCACYTCQTVSLPNALTSTGKINHPQLKFNKKSHTKCQGPSTYQKETHAAMPAVHLVRYSVTTGWVKHTVTVMKNLHHYISKSINSETSIYCSHMPYIPTTIIIFWSTKNMKKKRYDNIRFIVLHSIILSHQSLRILGPDPHHSHK